MVVLRRGAMVATALFALLAAPASARLEVSAPLSASLRTLDPAPTKFDFGKWPVNHVSTIRAFTFTYNGSNSDGTVIQGDPCDCDGDEDQFTVLAPRQGAEPQECADGMNLLPGESCDVRVQFAPTSAGAKATTLHVNDDDCGGECPSDNTVPLAGTGRLPLRSPSGLAFGDQGVGTTSAEKVVTVSNDSNDDYNEVDSFTTGNFARTTDCGSALPADDFCHIFVTFTPTAPGSRSGKLTITTESGNVDVALTGTGTVHLAHTPASLAFGGQRVGTQSALRNVTFTNDSNGPVTPKAATLTGPGAGHFAIASNGCTKPVAPDAKCVIGMRFTPTTLGAKSAALNLTSNSTSSPDVIPLTGAGIVHLAHAPASLAFGDQIIGTQSAVQNVTFTNDSGGPVTPQAPTVTGADAGQFAIASNGCTGAIAPGASCVIGMRFQPTAGGPRSAALNLASDSTTSPDVIALSGTGTTAASSASGPGIGFDVPTLDFGARIVNGGHLKQTLKLTNTGTQPLIVTSMTITGPNARDFSLAALTRQANLGCAPKTLAPGQSCSVDVNFLPGAPGDRIASLLIADNAPGSPHSLALLGSGLPPPVLFTTANAEIVSGEVTVALPPTAGARASVLKGRKFVPLTEARQVPIGAIFNTKKGRVRVATATTKRGKAQTGQFFAGLFQVLQRRSEKSLTEARLVGSNFKSCSASTGKNRARIAKKKKINKNVIRTLRANVKGKFRTRGRYAAATVRGTIWSMRDRCDGTLTKVTRGTVVVRDLRARRSIVVRTGKSAFVPKR